MKRKQARPGSAYLGVVYTPRGGEACEGKGMENLINCRHSECSEEPDSDLQHHFKQLSDPLVVPPSG